MRTTHRVEYIIIHPSDLKSTETIYVYALRHMLIFLQSRETKNLLYLERAF
jgi:hypothetical protein